LNRVLIIDNSREVTGAFRSMFNFTQILSPKINFFYAVPNGCWSEVSDIPTKKYFIFRFIEIRRDLSILWYIPQLIYNTIKAAGIVRKQAIDIVHVSDLYNMVGVCLKLFQSDIKLIYHIRLRKSSYVGFLYKIWLNIIKKFSDDIICVSKAVGKDVGDTSRVHILYDALPKSWLHHPRTYRNSSGSCLNLLYVSNYIPGKGQDLALAALKNTLQRIQGIKLKFIGGVLGNKKNQAFLKDLKEKAKMMDLQEHVIFEGQSDQIAREMLASDLVLNFSESESFSMVCLEALACAKPIIASQSGGPEEIIRHNVNGLIVRNRDVENMSQAIIKLVSDEDLRLMFSENAHLDFQEKFSLEKLSKRLQKIYLN